MQCHSEVGQSDRGSTIDVDQDGSIFQPAKMIPIERVIGGGRMERGHYDEVAPTDVRIQLVGTV